jgi:plastocyanin
MCLAAALVAVIAWPGSARAASTISGTVTFDGKPPALRPLAMDADPACAKLHSGPVPNEMLVLGSGSSMGNILVWVSKGLPAGKTWPAPKTPVTLDQKGCVYVPHVQGIMVGQPYRILNSDGILHNVHALPKVNKQFNRAMPPNLKEASAVFDKPEPVFQIKCDVHPWMSAYVGVDAGTYELTAWHERLGTQTATVTVGANETKPQNFKFVTPAK